MHAFWTKNRISPRDLGLFLKVIPTLVYSCLIPPFSVNLKLTHPPWEEATLLLELDLAPKARGKVQHGLRDMRSIMGTDERPTEVTEDTNRKSLFPVSKTPYVAQHLRPYQDAYGPYAPEL